MLNAIVPLALGLALPVAGQSPTPRADWAAMTERLLASAKRSVADAPGMFAPWIGVEIAEAELGLHSGPPTPAIDTDLDRAFRGALELRSPRADDAAEGQLLSQIKQAVERNVVSSLARRDYPLALAFARRADVPKREVYDQLLAAAARDAQKNNKDVTFDVIALIRECESADGSYPYQGMQKIVLNPGVAPEVKRQAMGLAFPAAARETRGYELAIATNLLLVASGHMTGFGQQIEDTAPALLEHMAAAATALGPRGNSEGVFGFQLVQEGVHLLSAVAEFDPDRARELQAQYPQFAATNPREATLQASQKTAFARQDLLKTYAPPAPQDNTPDADQFQAWAVRAEALAATSPNEALEDARRAVGLADAKTLAVRQNFLAAGDLAATLVRLKDPAAAAELLNRTFDLAEDKAVEASRKLSDAQGDERIKLLTDMFYLHDTSLLLLTAVRVNPSLVEARTESWRDATTRAEVLTAAARDLREN